MRRRGVLADMVGALLVLVLAQPDSRPCRDALHHPMGTLAERSALMTRTCGPLISDARCREAFERFHAVGVAPMPLRRLVAACRQGYCAHAAELDCAARQASDPVQLGAQWESLNRAIWEKECPGEANTIFTGLENWSRTDGSEPIGSMQLTLDGDSVVLTAHFGQAEERWTFAHNPEDGSFAPVEAWLEKHVPNVGVVAVQAHPHVVFRHIRAVMFALEAAGLPYVAFRLLPH